MALYASVTVSQSLFRPHSEEHQARTSPSLKGETRPTAISTYPLLQLPKRREQSDGYAAQTRVMAGGGSVGAAECFAGSGGVLFCSRTAND